MTIIDLCKTISIYFGFLFIDRDGLKVVLPVNLHGLPWQCRCKSSLGMMFPLEGWSMALNLGFQLCKSFFCISLLEFGKELDTSSKAR